MIAPEFLRLLVCPTTKQPLRVATPDELARVAAAVGAGKLHNRGGAAITTPWTAALATADGGWLYPIQDGIPILLTGEAVALPV